MMKLAVLLVPVAVLLGVIADKASCAHGGKCSADDDKSTLLQLKQQREVVKHMGRDEGCRQMLPILAAHGDAVREMCLRALPDSTCTDALDALGEGPWSDDVNAKLCEVW